MDQNPQPNILDDRRIKLLNFLLKNHVIPETGDFNLKDLITKIPAEEYNELFRDNMEFDGVWKNIDMPKSLTRFLIENDLPSTIIQNYYGFSFVFFCHKH